MSDITEGLGGAVEGGLLARAVEPAAGEGQGEAHGDCLNCGTGLQGAFCHVCGQKAHIHRTITAILHDLAHGVLHLDGKLWETLPKLAFKPGQLTRDYIEGKRARHVSPMAMFLFSVFLMFAVFQMVGLTVPTDLGSVKPMEFGPALTAQTEKVEAELKDVEEQLARTTIDAAKRAELEQQRAVLADRRERLAQLREMPMTAQPGQASPAQDIPIASKEIDGFDAKITGIDRLDKGLIKKWKEHPELMLYKLQGNSYKFSWLLIPLSIPFVWLLFLWRRQYKAYDHAIFVTYSLAFMSLLFIVLSLVGTSGTIGFWAFGVLILVPPIHLYKQLRGAYGLSRFSAFWRLMALSLFIWIVLILFLQVLLVLGGV